MKCYQGGVAVSADSGRTWKKSNSGMPENSVCTSILLDPPPRQDQELFMSVCLTGEYINRMTVEKLERV